MVEAHKPKSQGSLKQKMFETSMIVDDPDIRIVESRYRGKPVFLAIGTAKHRPKEVPAEGLIVESHAKREYKTEREFEWVFFFNREIIKRRGIGKRLEIRDGLDARFREFMSTVAPRSKLGRLHLA